MRHDNDLNVFKKAYVLKKKERAYFLQSILSLVTSKTTLI